MHTTSMSIAIDSAMASAKRVRGVPVAVVRLPKLVTKLTSYFVIPRFRKTSFKLAEVCNSIKVLLLDLQRTTNEQIIDPDLHMRDAMQDMKESMRSPRMEMDDFAKKLASLDLPELLSHVETVIALMDEVTELATELQWEMAEHDANFSRRIDGFQAVNIDELTAMLQRIPAAA